MLIELRRLQDMLITYLSDAQEDAKASIKNFFADKVLKMGAMIGHYHTTFTNLGVGTRAEMEASIGKFYQDKDVQDAADELFQTEEEWNLFLESVDRKIKPPIEGKTNQELVIGAPFPCDLLVTEVKSGR